MVKAFENEQKRQLSRHDLTSEEIARFLERLENSPKALSKKILKHKAEIVEIWKHFAKYTIVFNTIKEITFIP